MKLETEQDKTDLDGWDRIHAIRDAKQEVAKRMKQADFPHNCSTYEVLLVLQRRTDDAYEKMMRAKKEHTLAKALDEYTFLDSTLRALKDAMGMDYSKPYEHNWEMIVDLQEEMA
jgi:hypothetical protein